MLDDAAVQHLRKQFPSLNRPVDASGMLPVHFDNPAGTQVPQRVIDAAADVYLRMNANKGGTFPVSQRCDAMVQSARQRVAEFLNAPRADSIVFGPNMTTLNLSLSRAIGATLQPGDEVIVTRLDHDANVTPWVQIARDYELVVHHVDIDVEDCTLNLESYQTALSDKTRVVAVSHAANSVGTINPVAEMAALAHERGALVVVDAVQSAPHLPLDVQQLGCDFLLCSAYKFFGPHIGVMWGHYDLLAELPVYQLQAAPDVPPYRWETGTASFETIAGTAAALDYLAEAAGKNDFRTSMEMIVAYEKLLARRLIDLLQALPGIRIYGITKQDRAALRVPTVAFRLEGYTPRQVTEHLAAHHIYAWDGHYYALATVERLGLLDSGGMVRLGLVHYNTLSEIDYLGEVLQKLV